MSITEEVPRLIARLRAELDSLKATNEKLVADNAALVEALDHDCPDGWHECPRTKALATPHPGAPLLKRLADAESNYSAIEHLLACEREERDELRRKLADAEADRDAAIAETGVWKKEHEKVHGDWLEMRKKCAAAESLTRELVEALGVLMDNINGEDMPESALFQARAALLKAGGR